MSAVSAHAVGQTQLLTQVAAAQHQQVTSRLITLKQQLIKATRPPIQDTDMPDVIAATPPALALPDVAPTHRIPPAAPVTPPLAIEEGSLPPTLAQVAAPEEGDISSAYRPIPSASNLQHDLHLHPPQPHTVTLQSHLTSNHAQN